MTEEELRETYAIMFSTIIKYLHFDMLYIMKAPIKIVLGYYDTAKKIAEKSQKKDK